MSINPDIDAEIYRLADQGLSSRQIAKQIPDVSRSTIKRRLDARAEVGVEFADDDDEADEYEATMEMLDAMNARAVAEADVVAPISYAGLRPVSLSAKGIDDGPPVLVMIYTDANGVELDELGLYRFRQWLEGQGRWDESEQVQAELDAQCAKDDRLVLSFDMLGQNPIYEPRGLSSVKPQPS